MQCLILMESPLMRVVSQRRWSLTTDFILTKISDSVLLKTDSNMMICLIQK